MGNFTSILRKTLLGFYLLAIHALAALLVYQNYLCPNFIQTENYAQDVEDPTEKTVVPTPLPIPAAQQPIAAPTEFDSNQSQNSTPIEIPRNNQIFGAPASLIIPVVGVKREQLQDTFSDARSAGRVHNAIDIMADLGTPVVACADGEIAKFFDSKDGGTTIYQYSNDQKYVYYYAHLQKRADNLKEKEFVRRGTVIGFVGDTGNAGAGNYHLHFSIGILKDPKRFWEAEEINPFPILKDGIETR